MKAAGFENFETRRLQRSVSEGRAGQIGTGTGNARDAVGVRAVVEKRPRAGVPHLPEHLLGRKARVEGNEHGADLHERVDQNRASQPIAHEHRHAVARLHAEARHARRRLPRARIEVPVADDHPAFDERG